MPSLLGLMGLASEMPSDVEGMVSHKIWIYGFPTRDWVASSKPQAMGMVGKSHPQAALEYVFSQSLALATISRRGTGFQPVKHGQDGRATFWPYSCKFTCYEALEIIA